ncbi:MAG: hypothetical protein ACKOWP_04175 [Microbacteriaceae bacterium]
MCDGLADRFWDNWQTPKESGTDTMIMIARQLHRTFLELFPRGRHSWIVLSFVALGAMVPITDLLVAKLFSEIIMHGSTMATDEMITQAVFFFGLFIVMRGLHYFQKTYKIRVFKRAFEAKGVKRNRMQENWEWSLAFELTNSLTDFAKLIVFMVFFAWLSWEFGIVNTIILLASVQIMGYFFRKQLGVQKKFVDNRKEKVFVKPEEAVGGRIRMGETSALMANAGLMLILAYLLFASINGSIPQASLIVLFLGAKMQTSTLSNTSSSLMRLARARANQVGDTEDLL